MRRPIILAVTVLLSVLTGCSGHRVALSLGHDGINPTATVTFEPVHITEALTPRGQRPSKNGGKQ